MVKLFIKSFFVGFFSLIIPGVSASVVAMILGIYHLMITTTSEIVKHFRKSASLLAFIFVGYLVGVSVASMIFKYVNENVPFIFVLIILGVILGGIPKMFKNLKTGYKKPGSYIVATIVIVLMFAYTFILRRDVASKTFDFMHLSDYVKLYLVGMLASTSLLVPGVDFAILLLSLGYYQPFLKLIAELFTFNNVWHNLFVLMIYGSGYATGVLALSHMIKALRREYEGEVAFASFAFVIFTPVVVLNESIWRNPSFAFNFPELIIGIILGVLAFVIVYIIARKDYESKKEKIDITQYDASRGENEKYSQRIKKMPKRVLVGILKNLFLFFHMKNKFDKLSNDEKVSFEERYNYMQKFVQLFHKKTKVTVEKSGLDKLPNDLGGCIFMGNHQGTDDCIATLETLQDYPCTFVINADRSKNFLMDIVCNLVEAKRLDMYNFRKQVIAFNEMAEEITNGKRYIVFPEAWFTDNKNNLQEFHTPAFSVPIKCHCPIIPFCVYDTWRVFEDTTLKPLKVECHILDPIYYEEYHDMNKKELAELVRSRIDEKMQELKKTHNEI